MTQSANVILPASEAADPRKDADFFLDYRGAVRRVRRYPVRPCRQGKRSALINDTSLVSNGFSARVGSLYGQRAGSRFMPELGSRSFLRNTGPGQAGDVEL